MAYATYIITVPLTLFAIYFALSNPDDLKVALWPLADKPLTLPLNLFGLAMLGAGFLLGSLFVWLQYQKLRFRHWQITRKSTRLEKELEAIQRQKEAESASAASPAIAPPEQGAAAAVPPRSYAAK